MQKRIVAEADPRHNVRSAERNLLCLREVLIDDAVQYQFSDRDDRYELLRPELGRVEDV